MAQRVIRVTRNPPMSDEYVLVRLQSNGKDPLDLDITGTEGSNPFAAMLSQSNISTIKHKSYRGIDQDLITVLEWLFLGKAPKEEAAPSIKGVELLANVLDDQQIELQVQQQISGITRRLANIILSRDDDHEIELFNWTATTAHRANEAEENAHRLRSELSVVQAELSKATSQLDDLVNAKQSHENILLEKFRVLLNSKKLKIRDQQRLLTGAKVDSKTAEAVQSARSNTRTLHSSQSGRKRKAVTSNDVAGIVKDDAGMSMDEEDEEEVRQQTPQSSDLDEESDGFEMAAPQEEKNKTKVLPVETVHQLRSRQPVSKLDANEELDDVPPPRELPFAHSRQETELRDPDTQIKDEDDEETDDEL